MVKTLLIKYTRTNTNVRTDHNKYTVGSFEYSTMVYKYEYIKDANLPLYIEHTYICAYTPTWNTCSVRWVD